MKMIYLTVLILWEGLVSSVAALRHAMNGSDGTDDGETLKDIENWRDGK